MKPKKNILKILETLGHIFPSDKESVVEFEKTYRKEIEEAKPKYWENPLEILEQGKIEKIISRKSLENIFSKELAIAAREGRTIPDSMRKKMIKDREDASKKK